MRTLSWPTGAFRARYLLLLCAAPAPAHAQQPASVAGEIVVTGQRGMAVQADRVITTDEVAGYGLNNIDELLEEIARERSSGRGATVYLVDGQRVTGLGDIGAYPTEAIERIEVLPTGAAAQFGGTPSQQVVKITLKPQLRSYVGRGSLALATDGGFSALNGEIGLTDIRRPRRINLVLRWRQEAALLESDRDIQQLAGAPANLGQFRSLRPKLTNFEVRGSVADQLAPSLNAIVNVRLFGGINQSYLGRDGNGNQLNQSSRLNSGNFDLQLNGEAGSWLLGFYASYGENLRRTLTGSGPASGAQFGSVSQTRARVSTASAEVNATGPLLALPAGSLSLTMRGRISRNAIAVSSDSFTQSNRELGFGVQIPISNTAGAFSAFGELTAGIDWTYNSTSRVGTFSNTTYSLQWQPASWLRFGGTISTGKTPPGVELTSGPLLATPGLRYFDPLSGEASEVVALTGGNPALSAQSDKSQRLTLEVKPSGSIPLVMTAEYSNVRNSDIIAVLPPGNSLLLAAFPDRFLRDSSGRLIAVDSRPLNFARQSEEQLRYGFELSVPLRDDDEPALNRTSPAQGRPPSGDARLRFNLSHTILLKSEVIISPGFEPVDLLSQDAFGFNGGERPRHEFDIAAEYSSRGLGVRLSGQHKSQSFFSQTGGATPNVLRFSPLTTVNLRAFANGQHLWPSAAWLNGTRFSLLISNIGNARQEVRDSTGATPLLYQKGYRDPVGRVVQFEFRKIF